MRLGSKSVLIASMMLAFSTPRMSEASCWICWNQSLCNPVEAGYTGCVEQESGGIIVCWSAGGTCTVTGGGEDPGDDLPPKRHTAERSPRTEESGAAPTVIYILTPQADSRRSSRAFAWVPAKGPLASLESEMRAAATQAFSCKPAEIAVAAKLRVFGGGMAERFMVPGGGEMTIQLEVDAAAAKIRIEAESGHAPGRIIDERLADGEFMIVPVGFDDLTLAVVVCKPTGDGGSELASIDSAARVVSSSDEAVVWRVASNREPEPGTIRSVWGLLKQRYR